MDSLFSCNNCIMNPVQYGPLGSATGYCLQHKSILKKPCATTCHYLHRKDLPGFLLDEAHSEHQAEYPNRTEIVYLDTKRVIKQQQYSEKYYWDTDSFNADLHFAALYTRTPTKWQLIQTLAGSSGAVRAMMHAVMTRRYMLNCGKWTSAYRLMLALANELDLVPLVEDSSFWVKVPIERSDAIKKGATWDVMMLRVSTIQEFGNAASDEDLMWITDKLNGSLVNSEPSELADELVTAKKDIVQRIIELSKRAHVYFGGPG